VVHPQSNLTLVVAQELKHPAERKKTNKTTAAEGSSRQWSSDSGTRALHCSMQRHKQASTHVQLNNFLQQTLCMWL
jgi:hypothetical protein